MREIKFRAWVKRYVSMCDVLEISYASDTKLIVSVFCIDELGYQTDEIIDMEFPAEGELLQFTGLHDKNGEEIYEGDIFRNEYDIEIRPRHYGDEWVKERKIDISEVKWGNVDGDEYGSWMGWSIDIYDAKKGEVIGNIYENPELLKTGDGK